MLFGSLEFWLILPIVIILHYQIPLKFRWTVLLAGSLIYLGYLSVPFLIYTIIFSIANYLFGRILNTLTNKSTRKKFYLLFLVINSGQLVVFKYINFLIENINWIISTFNTREIPYIQLLVPVGISYFTFQCIGYIVNVYRKRENPEKHLGYFLIYNLFFPKFLSGPIERSEKFLPQLRSPKSFDPELFRYGLKLMLFGMFKKLVIAERLSVIVYNLYGDVDNYAGFPLIIVMFLQALYIYTDFSGYTDLALGIASFFGISLTNNFQRPFFATNVSNFWRRWHISLTSWCNDYIFMTILFKRRRWGNIGAVYAVFITFLIIGIWHGPMWTYVVLGVMHSLAIIYEFFTKRKRVEIGSKIPLFWNNLLSRLITYVFFCFSLIFFFGESFADSIYYIRHLFDFKGSVIIGNNLGLIYRDVIIVSIAIIVLFIIEMQGERGSNLLELLHEKPTWIRWTVYYLLIFIIILYGQFATTNFVYFQF